MSKRFIHNTLRTQRKRAGLTQKEVAALLGLQDGTQLSRYENSTREPTLKTALAFHAIYKVPLHELFADLYAEVEPQVNKRAVVQRAALPARKNRRTEYKSAFLLRVVERKRDKQAR